MKKSIKELAIPIWFLFFIHPNQASIMKFSFVLSVLGLISSSLAAPAKVMANDEFWLLVISTNATLNGRYVQPRFQDEGVYYAHAWPHDQSPEKTFTLSRGFLSCNDVVNGENLGVEIGKHTEPTGYDVMNIDRGGWQPGFSFTDNFLYLDGSENWYLCFVDNPIGTKDPTVVRWTDGDVPEECFSVKLQKTPVYTIQE